MKALVLSNLKMSLQNVEVPKPDKGECLIKVKLAGICNTDLEIIKGYMNFSGIAGHEFVGVVEESPDESFLGKRVVGEINIGCGKCGFCLSGNKEHCTDRSVLGIFNKNGVFAQYITLPLENLFIVPDSVSDEESVFVEPLAAVIRIFDQVKIRPNTRIGILGDGKLALLIAMVLQSSGFYKFSIFGHHKSKLDLIKDQNTEKFLTVHENQFQSYDYIVEATGSQTGFEQALNLLKPQGTLILKSTIAGLSNFNLAPIVINEINLIGSRCGRFMPALNMLSAKKIDLSDMITAKYNINNWEIAFERAEEKDSLKILLEL